ncbi:hypothetical protein CPC08DRAFT_559716 [Agrocybe pediades]|nr:hypothetical protein CPC08DRAFT_559716 [Agrocybe pediades]
MVTRRFLSSTYGGNPQEAFPKPSQKFLNIHGMDDWMYINPNYQPEAPQLPGAPGLFFGSQPSDEGYKEVLRVFTRIKDGIWQYMGMYELKGCTPPSLTRAEWQEQPQKVRSKWAKEIYRQGWGENIRAGILGRKMFGKRRLTKEEFDEAMSKTDALNSITPDEVYRALDEGIESLGVYTMKCVGYDNAFQLEICEKFASYVPPPPKARKASNATKPPGQKQNKAPATSKTRGKKRKRQSSKNDHDSDNTDGKREWAAEESDGHEGVELKMYKNRGTRSRPTVPT